MTETAQIKRKGLVGILYFLGNSSYAAVLGLAANLVFTILLTPAEYGLYFIVLSLIAIFNYFTDLGLAAALIQRQKPSEVEFYTAFTIQLALVGTVTLLGLALTPLIIRLYHFQPAGIYLYLSMLFSLFLLSFKSIPSTRLERQLEYGKIVLTQVLENTFFYGVSIILMLLGWRIYALVAAIIVRSILGVILIYFFTRWRPKLSFSRSAAKKILSFGIPFQSNVFLAFIKDDLLNLYLANRLGLAGIGYVGWAKKWAEAPLRIIMDNVNRVLFPVFSQVQDDPQRIKKGIEKILFYNSLILLPTLLGAYLVMPYFVELVPRYSKWVGAIPSFNFFLISSFLVSLASPFINIFNSLGKVRTSVRFMILWIILNWTIVPLMVTFFGFTGVAIAFSLNAGSFILVWAKLRQMMPVNFVQPLTAPLLSGLLMLVVVKFSQQFVHTPWLSLAVSIIVGALSYGGLVFYLTKGSFFWEIKELLANKNQPA